ENGSSYIAVDAGNTADHIQHELQVLGIDPKTVTSVFLTHSDADHTGALELFYNAVIYLSKAEEQMINGQTHRFLFLKNKFKGKYELLEDNQLLNLSGLRVKAISTPGHTPGSMCFLINDTFLFTGDSMGLKNGKTTEFNDLFNMDTQTQKISLKKLADLPAAAYIFTAHYGFTVQGQDPFSTWKK
ncbi:MAG: MBL fold metallo-hydrolase, partial [Proteobacteria bacterium]|nr:MBL fold metallo-hydrolase [Pseudomonadota bacterium]